MYLILFLFFHIYLASNYDYYMGLYNKQYFYFMEKGDIYYFTISGETKRDVEIRIYLKLSDYSSFSNLFTIEYALNDYYITDHEYEHEDYVNTEIQTTNSDDYLIIYAKCSYYSETEKYLVFKVIPNQKISDVNVIIVESNLSDISLGNIIYFLIFGLCLTLCIITLIKTNSCPIGDSKFTSNPQIPNEPIQPQIQNNQEIGQNQSLL